MPKLITMVAPALALALGVGALPAQAHDNHRDAREYRHDNGRHDSGRHDAGRYTPVRNADIRSDINELRRDIDRAAGRRAISTREANGLRADARNLQRLYVNYARNGLTRAEANALERRVDRIRIALRVERRDMDRRRG